jgi:hypothetical protein
MSYATEQMRVVRWANHGSDWPDGHRQCMKCEEVKPLTGFHRHVKCKGGYNSVCKGCRKPLSKQQHASRTIQRRLYDSAKSRSTKLGRNFDITLDDIVIPPRCPVFDKPFEEKTAYAASIDRIDSSLGYVRGNIQVISLRANLLKNNATLEELECLVSFLKAGVCEVL